jgi:exopolysaccharide biosynthesis polyprenyl glycosylphosphotransferase
LNDFETVVKTKDVHEVFITIPSEKEKILDIVTKAHQMSVSVKVLPELFNLLSREVTFEALGPFTLAKLFRPALSPLQRSMKRLCDVVFAFLLLIFFTPLSIVIILAIKLDGRGPVLFRQTRLGEGGRSFQLMKFRSMHVDVDDAIHREYVTKLIRSAAADRRGQKINKLGNDPRITRVGRIIRRYNLDEIPQLWNVLKGDLSLVGPRPPLPYEYDEYEEYYKKRLLIRPGLTGLWQVSGRYEMDYEQMVMLDIRYINEWSLGLDFKIILETIPQILRPTGS